MTGTGTGAPELDGAPLFLLDSLPQTEELLVDGAEGRHAVEVLRLAPGERVRVGDGQGTVAEGNVLAADAAGLRVAVLARYEVPAPAPEFVLVQALPKGDHGPLAVDLAPARGGPRPPARWASPPSSGAAGSSRGRRPAASPAGATTAWPRAWRSGGRPRGRPASSR